MPRHHDQQHHNRRGGQVSREREFGIVQTVKAPFGFIRCLDRPNDLFFSLNDLPDAALGQEVSFLVSTHTRGDETKTHAVNIQHVPSGTVVFEQRSAERFVGVCSRAIAASRGGGHHRRGESSARGSIDVTPAAASSTALTSKRIAFDRDAVARVDVLEGDSVSFVLLTDKRNKQERAVDIELVALGGERELGVVVRYMAAGGFGFIKSVSSVAEVYFHRTALVLLASDGHAPPSSTDEPINLDALLHSGTPVEFALSTDGGKVSATRVRVLPRSTVIEFDRTLPVRFRGTVARTGRGAGGGSRHGGKGDRAGSAAAARGSPALAIDAVAGDATAGDVEKALIGKSVTFGSSDLRDMRAAALQEGDIVEFGLLVSKANGSPSRAVDIVFVAPAPVQTEDGVVVSTNEERGFGFFETLERDAHVYFRLSDVVGGATVRVGTCVRAHVDSLDNGKKVLGKDVTVLPDNSVVLFVRENEPTQSGVIDRVAKPFTPGSIVASDLGYSLAYSYAARAAKSSEDANLVAFSGGCAEMCKGDVVEFVRETHGRSGLQRAVDVRIRTPKGADPADLTHGRIDVLPSHKRREDRGVVVVHDAAKTKLPFSSTQVLSQRLAAGMEVSFVVVGDKAYRVRLRSGEIVGSQEWTGVVASGASEINVTPATVEETAAAIPADNALLDKRGARPASVSFVAPTGRGTKRSDRPATGDTVRFTPVRRGKHVTATNIVIVARHMPEPPPPSSTTTAAPTESTTAPSKQAKINAAEAGVTQLRAPINHDNSRGFTGKREFTAADRQALIDKLLRINQVK